MLDIKPAYIYLKQQPVLLLTTAYIALLLFLKAAWNIDIGIPCLWKSVFNIKCPGCGLTRAGHCLITLDLKGAAQNNPLIFILIPATVYYFIQDFRKFNIKNN